MPPVSTLWVETVAYNGRCESGPGLGVLQVSGRPGAPQLNPIPDSGWGLHLVDANIALGNLVDVVGVQAFVHTLLSRFRR
ncbi:MAG: hypothetical protein ACRDKV_00785 [Solirubrobacterales bacterium]